MTSKSGASSTPPEPSDAVEVKKPSEEVAGGEPQEVERPIPQPQPTSGPKDDEAEEFPLDAHADAVASRHAPFWDAGGKIISGAYWGAIGVFIAGLFRANILPFVDYPQHLALASILRKMLSSGAPERVLYETNLLSYNSLFHILVAGFNLVVPIDAAGKLGISVYLVLLALAMLQLMKAIGRPRTRAFLILPVAFGYSVAWGFLNFGLGCAIQMLVLARVLDRLENKPKKPLRADLITAGLAVLGGYAHLLATALLYMFMLVAIVVRVQTNKRPFFVRFGHAMRVGVPLLPAIAYCYWVYRRQMAAAFQNFEYASGEGNDVFALVKVKEFTSYATGLHADQLDGKVLMIGLGLLVISALLRDEEDKVNPAVGWIFATAALAYLAIPHVFWATNFVFERISFFVILGFVLWVPRAKPQYEQGLRFGYVSVGLAAAVSFFGLMGQVAKETADLDAILTDAPKGRRVTGLVFHPRIDSLAQWSMVHTPAYYVARNGGEVAFSFTRTMSLPVHYRREKMPPDPPPNFEWQPNVYRPNSEYARYFDLVLMKTTYDDNVDPRASVWGAHADEVDLVAHRGRWWIFETKRVTETPVPPLFDRPDDPDLPE